MPWKFNPFTEELDYYDPVNATTVDAAGAVMESDFEATTFLYATSDDTPQPKTPAEVMAILSGQAGAAFSWNSQSLTAVGSIVVDDGGTIGQADGPLITFDDINNYLEIIRCKVGILTPDPIANLDIYGASSSLMFKTEDADGYGVYSFQNQLNWDYGIDANSVGYINYRGYAYGATQFRDLAICDGKQGVIAFFDGSTGNVGIGTIIFGTTMAKGMQIALATDPTGNVVDTFAYFGKDIAAGNTGPAWRTENGTVIQLDQSLKTTDAPTFNKIKITAIGGTAIQLTNKTGANTVAGKVVEASTTTDDAFQINDADGNHPIGIVLDAGIADGSEAWIVVNGIADVAIVSGEAATRGWWVFTSDAGYCTMLEDPTGGGAAELDQHMREVGHCIETVAANGVILARCVIHFN